MFPEVLNVQQAADFMGLGKDAIYKLSQKGEIPCMKIRGKYRYSKQALTDYIYNNSVAEKPVKEANTATLYNFK